MSGHQGANRQGGGEAARDAELHHWRGSYNFNT
jgi:hypothetical protein